LSGAYRLLDGMAELLDELQKTEIPMYALSNYSRWYELIEERLEISRWVSWRFVSCDTGLRKPDRETFLFAARALEVPPERCLFVDDRKPNCESARSIGMPSIHFRDALSLRAQLVQNGVLVG
jgi:HAD superfamily hydrolase (TIGR01509 family)